MPYAFDETLNALGLTGQNEGDPNAGGNAVLSDAEGDIGAGGQAGGAPKAPTQAVSAPTAGGKRAIMQRNEGKSQAPADLQKMNTAVSGAKQSLQQEANAYVDSADDNYEMSDDQIKANVQGYAKGGVSPDKAAWLSYFQQGTPELAQPFKQQTNTKVEDVDLLKNDSGIRELYRRGQDAEGTMGEAALDTALLRKNQDFNVKRDETVRNYKDLKEGEKEVNASARQKAQDKINASATDYKNRVGKTAEGMLPEYDTRALERERAFDERLGTLEQERQKKTFDEAQAFLDRMADSGQYDEYTAKALRQALGAGFLGNAGIDPLDPMQFYRAGKGANDTNASQFYTDEEAGEWNNLMSLLGKGGTTRAGGGLANTDAYGYLGGGMDWDRFSDAALKFATPLGTDYKTNTEAMAKAAADKQRAIEAEAARVKYQEYLDAQETQQEMADRLNKDEGEYSERERVRTEREDEEVKKKQEKRNMNSWNPFNW